MGCHPADPDEGAAPGRHDISFYCEDVRKTVDELKRRGVEFKSKVIVRERSLEATLFYQYAVGVCYLAIGLFVYLRRNRAAHSIHFYCLCLASFALFTFHYTGKLNNFDKVMYWGNVVAGVFAPTIFVHFCLAFPESPSRWAR